MKLYRKYFNINKNDFYLYPTIRIFTNSFVYCDKNIALEFHFLFMHARLLWLEEGEAIENEYKFDVIVTCQGQAFHHNCKTLFGAIFKYVYLYLKKNKYGTMNFELRQVFGYER